MEKHVGEYFGREDENQFIGPANGVEGGELDVNNNLRTIMVAEGLIV